LVDRDRACGLRAVRGAGLHRRSGDQEDGEGCHFRHQPRQALCERRTSGRTGPVCGRPLGGEYRVPFLFSTNARPYLDPFKEKSGIWFLDVRSPNNHPRPLRGWYSPDELVALFRQDIPVAQRKLSKEPMDYLKLRDYQEKAIRRIETALNQGRVRLLVAMATGTGKTRLAVGLIYRLIKTGRFRRFTREQIVKRGDSLDISWLQDESVRRGDDLPDPADIADEILAQLSIATEEMQELARLLGERS